MTEEEKQLLKEIHGVIAELPPGQLQVCNALAQQFRELVEENGPAGLLALALVGAELQARA